MAMPKEEEEEDRQWSFAMCGRVLTRFLKHHDELSSATARARYDANDVNALRKIADGNSSSSSSNGSSGGVSNGGGGGGGGGGVGLVERIAAEHRKSASSESVVYNKLERLLRWRRLFVTQLRPEDVGADIMSQGGFSFHGTCSEGRRVAIWDMYVHAMDSYSSSTPSSRFQSLKRYMVLALEGHQRKTAGSIAAESTPLTLLIDMRRCPLRHADLEFVKFVIDCLVAYYPGTLGRLVVVDDTTTNTNIMGSGSDSIGDDGIDRIVDGSSAQGGGGGLTDLIRHWLPEHHVARLTRITNSASFQRVCGPAANLPVRFLSEFERAPPSSPPSPPLEARPTTTRVAMPPTSPTPSATSFSSVSSLASLSHRPRHRRDSSFRQRPGRRMPRKSGSSSSSVSNVISSIGDDGGSGVETEAVGGDAVGVAGGGSSDDAIHRWTASRGGTVRRGGGGSSGSGSGRGSNSLPRATAFSAFRPPPIDRPGETAFTINEEEPIVPGVLLTPDALDTLNGGEGSSATQLSSPVRRLTVVPPDQIVFTGALEEEICETVSLENTKNDAAIAVKIRTSNLSRYRVRPRAIVLAPNTIGTLTILRRPVPTNAADDVDYFQLLSTALTPSEARLLAGSTGKEVTEFWRKLDDGKSTGGSDNNNNKNENKNKNKNKNSSSSSSSTTSPTTDYNSRYIGQEVLSARFDFWGFLPDEAVMSWSSSNGNHVAMVDEMETEGATYNAAALADISRRNEDISGISAALPIAAEESKGGKKEKEMAVRDETDSITIATPRRQGKLGKTKKVTKSEEKGDNGGHIVNTLPTSPAPTTISAAAANAANAGVATATRNSRGDLHFSKRLILFGLLILAACVLECLHLFYVAEPVPVPEPVNVDVDVGELINSASSALSSMSSGALTDAWRDTMMTGAGAVVGAVLATDDSIISSSGGGYGDESAAILSSEGTDNIGMSDQLANYVWSLFSPWALIQYAWGAAEPAPIVVGEPESDNAEPPAALFDTAAAAAAAADGTVISDGRVGAGRAGGADDDKVPPPVRVVTEEGDTSATVGVATTEDASVSTSAAAADAAGSQPATAEELPGLTIGDVTIGDSVEFGDIELKNVDSKDKIRGRHGDGYFDLDQIKNNVIESAKAALRSTLSRTISAVGLARRAKTHDMLNEDDQAKPGVAEAGDGSGSTAATHVRATDFGAEEEQQQQPVCARKGCNFTRLVPSLGEWTAASSLPISPRGSAHHPANAVDIDGYRMLVLVPSEVVELPHAAGASIASHALPATGCFEARLTPAIGSGVVTSFSLEEMVMDKEEKGVAAGEREEGGEGNAGESSEAMAQEPKPVASMEVYGDLVDTLVLQAGPEAESDIVSVVSGALENSITLGLRLTPSAVEFYAAGQLLRRVGVPTGTGAAAALSAAAGKSMRIRLSVWSLSSTAANSLDFLGEFVGDDPVASTIEWVRSDARPGCNFEYEYDVIEEE